MKYIIMADGKERRWHNYSGIHKWQIKIENENLLERTVRLVRTYDPDASVIITSHDESINIEGAVRYEPQNNKIEIDRFTWELIGADVVFLYGDSFYTENAISSIVESKTESILFFGSEKRIFAVKVADEELFRHHVQTVREAFVQGRIKECIGWQVYQSFQGLEFGKKQIAGNYVLIDDGTCDFNEPVDYLRYLKTTENETDDRAIALFDSGMGGLTCVEALKKLLPEESIIYYGDCLRAPYGDRPVETLKQFSLQIAEFLTSQKIKMLVVACNTISSLCIGDLQDRYPSLPIVGMIDMTAKYVAGKYAEQNIGIIATSATIKSGVYARKLRECGCTGELYPLACPGFVPAVEAGIHDGPEAEAVVRDALDLYLQEDHISVLLLGCTHFPFLRPVIERLYPSVEIVDPAEIVAQGIKNMLDDHVLTAGSGADIQRHYYTSKLTDAYAQAVKEISGNDCYKIEIKVLGE